MRFLADESCDFAVLRALRRAGHDVIAVAETARGSPDEDVLQMALLEERILLTEDKDFGQLVFAAGVRNNGVILMRFPVGARDSLAAVIVDLVQQRGADLLGRFTVVQPGRIRVGVRLQDA